ncbi:helix-hairpin-helix domain-containing protein [Compostibacter hankyongensis]|uniref:Helix-hairpin-helix domain-containing protein n=1 Tax=Compostibacter hankyongensis TaxID=1007089 RepID=A0ABP8FY50_9BACT
MKITVTLWRPLLFGLFWPVCLPAQTRDEPSEERQAAIEDLAEAQEEETEDDESWQQLTALRHQRIDLNTATEETLNLIPFLSPLQVSSFLQYRDVLGKLASIYELQAVPGFDPVTIRRLLPYVTTGGDDLSTRYTFSELFKKGTSTLLFRYGRTLERSRGYRIADTAEAAGRSYYPGSPDKILLRYRYLFSRHLSYGITAEKDPGEEWFGGTQRRGFDFYSVHLFLQDRGHLKALVLGDFTVNLGQGLVNWQSLAFGKGAMVMNIRRTAPLLRPHTAAGESAFYRGGGATLRYGAWEFTAFGSYRNLDATLITADTAAGTKLFSGFRSSGYHRTPGELAGRASIGQASAGGNISFHRQGWHIGINGLYHRLSGSLQKRPALYNRFALQGNRFSQLSLDYSAALHNLYFFGEAALSGGQGWAAVSGLLISADPKIDLALLYRYADKQYQTLYGNSFGNSGAGERGFYTGFTLRPAKDLSVSGYADFFQYAWLKYRVNAPSNGNEYMFQAVWEPSSGWGALLRYQRQEKPLNSGEEDWPVDVVSPARRNRLRLQVHSSAEKRFEVRGRADLVFFKQEKQPASNGMLIYGELLAGWTDRFRSSFRMGYFHTDDFDARIYTYERNVRYVYSIPFFYGEGLRAYLLLHYRLGRSADIGMRMSRTVYFDRELIGSGLDEISGRHKTTFTLQLLWEFEKKQ